MASERRVLFKEHASVSHAGVTEICAACLVIHLTHTASRCSQRGDSEERPLSFVSVHTPLHCCLPEGGHEVAGGPAHDEAPLWAGASLTHFLYAVGHPHLTHSDLGLHLKVGGRPTGDKVLSVKRSLQCKRYIDLFNLEMPRQSFQLSVIVYL